MRLLAQHDDAGVFGLRFEPLLQDSGIPLAVMGILVVFAALALISLFITLLPRCIAILERYHPEKKEHSSQLSRAKDDLPEETLVVIAAAVAESLEQPHRIIHTRQLTAEEMAWSLEGRMQHHTSHRTPRRDRR